jgi:hypothetical protein
MSIVTFGYGPYGTGGVIKNIIASSEAVAVDNTSYDTEVCIEDSKVKVAIDTLDIVVDQEEPTVEVDDKINVTVK